MAKVIIFKTGKIPQILNSVNTPDYVDDPDVIVNPDLSSVEGVPQKFWKRDGDNVVEMTQSEKDAVITQELEQRKSSADTFASEPLAIFTALIKVINVRLNANQKITRQEMIDAVKEEIT